MENIVVTGMGIQAPGIANTEQFLDVLKNGVCNLSVLTSAQEPESKLVAGVVKETYTTAEFKEYKKYPRAVKMAIAAAKEAIEMANLASYPSHKIGVVLGTAAGAIKEIAEYSQGANHLKMMPLHGIALVDAHTLSNAVCEAIGANGTSFTIMTGCTASIDALLVGQQLIQSGMVDICLVGGADAPLNDWTKNGFKKIRALTNETDIAKAGVPFSVSYKGFAMAEGAGVIVLERELAAKQRQQKIYGKIERVVSRNEGLKMLRSDTTGQHMLEVFKQTVGEVKPTYINSQALGMEINDRIEQKLAEQCFYNEVPITSIKGMIGHTFGAMGAMQMIASFLSMAHQFIPPTIKTDKKGFEQLPLVMEMTAKEISSVVITTHSSSGNNACVLISAYKDDGNGIHNF